MKEFLIKNGGTIITLIVIAGVVGMIITGMIKDKRKGKSSCGCSCGCCPGAGTCHPENKK